MAWITDQLENGCCDVRELPDGTFLCSPRPDGTCVREQAFNIWTPFYAMVLGAANELVRVRLRWFRYEEGQNCGDDPWERMCAPFGRVVSNLIFLSDDGLEWRRVEDAVTEGDDHVFSFRLRRGRAYLSVGLPFTWRMYLNLRETILPSPYVQSELFRTEERLRPMEIFTVTDPAVPAENKRSVWYQACQHPQETAGSLLADCMLRYLVTDEAAELRRKYVFHILPVVSADDWVRCSLRHASGVNPNRDWNDGSVLWEVRTIKAYLLEKQAEGERFLAAFDAHTGLDDTANPDRCVALITTDDDLPEDVRRRQLRLIDMLIEGTSFFPPDAAWHVARYPTKNVAIPTGQARSWLGTLAGQAHTLEICKQSRYDRGAGRAVPPCYDDYRRLSRDFLETLDRFGDTV